MKLSLTFKRISSAAPLIRRAALSNILTSAAPKIVGVALTTLFLTVNAFAGISIRAPRVNEDIFSYINRVNGGYSVDLYRKILGAANAYKDGDEAIGVSAADSRSRTNARRLLARTRLAELESHPLYEDEVSGLITTTTDKSIFSNIGSMTVGELKAYLLSEPASEIKTIMPGLSSDAIASVAKLMSNAQLTEIGKKVFNPLPGSHIGAKGYMGARLQPNSPTDDPEDVAWQVFDGWSYGVGDVMLGTNPASSEPDKILGIELTLKDIIESFHLKEVLPWTVLSHVDIQSAVEKKDPGSTALFFQSIAGTESANHVFDISTPKMIDYTKARHGKYGMYFETGQGSDFTNGQSHGVDMVTLESRKYGFSRAMGLLLSKSNGQRRPWMVVNDVAGFIGPEVFKTKEQLVRVALEDTVMGKLHGLTIGLDVCTTLHMSVSLDDLNWALDRIMPANPAYLMALPTKNDPMLSYLTTAFQDHVRIRNKFGYKVNDAMWAFFKRIQIIDGDGKPTKHFGDPVWVYSQFRKAKGDRRPEAEIYAEGVLKAKAVESRGVPLAQGYDGKPWIMKANLRAEIQELYKNAKTSLWSELTPEFLIALPEVIGARTESADRNDYIAHPPTGEVLSPATTATIQKLRDQNGNAVSDSDVQIVISDGLNAKALTDEGHVLAYLPLLREALARRGYKAAKENIVVTSGRVRAGYKIGETLFGESASANPKIKTVIHIIGERPGTKHNNFSAYIASATAADWAVNGKVDHDRVQVVSGISDTAMTPRDAVAQTLHYLEANSLHALKCRDAIDKELSGPAL